MPINCDFLLQRQSISYYTGEQIVGSISISSSKRLQLEGLSIMFQGNGEVSWSAYDKSSILGIEHNDCSAKKLQSKTNYTGQQQYHKEVQQLIGNTIILEPHQSIEAAFTFFIPPNLPASCNYAYGKVAYKLSVQLRRKGKRNKNYEKQISIKRKLDLRFGDKHMLAETTCNTCSSGDYKLTIPRTGYMPGQTITFNLAKQSSNNQSNLHPLHAQITLNQSITYHSQQPIQSKKQVNQILDRVECEAINLLNQQSGSLRIPLTAPISFSNQTKQLLDLNYSLDVIIYDSKFKIVENLKLPIIIATCLPTESNALVGTAAFSEERLFFCYDNWGAANSESLDNLNLIYQQCNYSAAVKQTADVSQFHRSLSERRKLIKVN